jgi:cell division protein FtsQ
MAKEAARSRSGWRWLLRITVWAAVAVCVIAAVRRVEAFTRTDAQFTLEWPRSSDSGPILVDGARNASRVKILRVFQPDVGGSVFDISLAERRRRLLAIDWVEDATVSRLWPNRIWVKITERTPVAFVRAPLAPAGGAKLALIDREGVILEQPPRAHFDFPLLVGVTPEQPEAERRRRVAAMLALLEDLGEVARQISEVNAEAPDNLSVVAQVEGAAVELTLGDINFKERFQGFLAHYPEIRRRTPHATAFDLRLDDRITARE